MNTKFDVYPFKINFPNREKGGLGGLDVDLMPSQNECREARNHMTARRSDKPIKRIYIKRIKLFNPIVQAKK